MGANLGTRYRGNLAVLAREAVQVRALECVQGYQNKKKAIMASRPGGVEEFDPPVKTMNKASEYTGSLALADQDHNVRHSRP